jgi:hypothetical protein
VEKTREIYGKYRKFIGKLWKIPELNEGLNEKIIYFSRGFATFDDGGSLATSVETAPRPPDRSTREPPNELRAELMNL